MTDPIDPSPEPSDHAASRGGRRAEILDVAERLARRGGYHGFSFRDVAAEVGVKSASVHYHFRTKADLVEELVGRYRARFLERLGPAGEAGALLGLIGAFRAAIREQDGACLCGLLGAEIAVLPESARDAVGAFFDELVGWTAAALGAEEGDGAADGAGAERRAGAEAFVAGLEGALILARATGDPALYDRTAARLLDAARGARWETGGRAGLS